MSSLAVLSLWSQYQHVEFEVDGVDLELVVVARLRAVVGLLQVPPLRRHPHLTVQSLDAESVLVPVDVGEPLPVVRAVVVELRWALLLVWLRQVVRPAMQMG